MVEPTSQPKLALALGGGAVRGVAHLGVLRALEEARLEVSAIAGTSSGALIALLYALKRSGLLPTLEWETVLAQLGAPHFRILARPHQRPWASRLVRLPVAWRGLRSPFLATLEPVRNALEKVAAKLTFCDLPIPLAFVTTDIERGQPVILREGPVVPAVLASCAVPGVFPPVFHNGRYLADGCLVNNLPADVARTLLKGKPGVVVAVNVDADITSTEAHNAWEAYNRGVSISRHRLSALASEEADLVLTVQLEVPPGYFDLGRAETLYETGLAVGREAVAAINLLLSNNAGADPSPPAQLMKDTYLTHS